MSKRATRWSSPIPGNSKLAEANEADLFNCASESALAAAHGLFPQYR
jgi:hypothetical protein